MDESGFTGEDLLSAEQPTFVHVSTCLSDDECALLAKSHFSGVQGNELKHKNLSRRPRGQRGISAFVKAVRDADKFTIWLCHKEFLLLTYLVDLWVEPSMHLHGIDLYRDGGNVALSNMTYYCLRTFQDDRLLREHLQRFQKMMRYRTYPNYLIFFDALYKDYLSSDKRTQDILLTYLGAAELGFDQLRRTPPRALDPSLTTTVETCAHWRKRTEGPLRLIHDQSSNLSKDKWLWDLVASPEIDNAILGIPGREVIYPLNVIDTKFADSRSHLQLQFCDLIAGASAEWARSYMDLPHDESYVSELEKAGISDLNLSTIWPAPEVDPEALGRKGWSGAHIEFLSNQMEKLHKRPDRGS